MLGIRECGDRFWAEMSESRGLIKSMMVIGSAQAVNIVISIFRIKLLAVLLGPSGVGLLSIYTSLQGVVTTAAGLGIGSSGVRQIARAKGEEQALSRVRRVLLAAHLVQGAFAMLGVWLFSAPISEWLFGDRSYATEVGLIGLAILLTLLGTAHTTLLQGMRRIGDLGRVTVISALVGTIAGLAAVWLYGEAGLVWFVVVQPLATFVIAMRFTRLLPKPTTDRPSVAEIWDVWKPMVKLGAAFMLSGLATTATLLLVRGRITQELGLEAAGHFAAAWGITMTYVGFLLGAMAADYYPRLTEVITDRAAANRLMNDQAQLGLAIGGPILLLLIGLAPWAVTLLYSAEFVPAVELLQWQTVGNVFKLASWALGFSFVAAARGGIFLLVQINFNVLFLAMLWFGLEAYGLTVAGPAFLIAYFLHFALINILVHLCQGFRWQSLSLLLVGLHATLTLCLLILARTAPEVAALASIGLALLSAVFGLRVVLAKIGSEGRVATQFARAFRRINWPIRYRLD
ncbi:O-antigen translocase (plasmid) [Sulfitobacter sp. OXR-159]|uniref:O-antigen translocase n=1 Tax=Sulfitobacter sp. OXR-159 TaxID=3100174 RepID=UPI002AC8AFC2|nr:O-antigen translocase [Sulfitobacter sp. OXR-159]WPZ31540.1 O-antigen translocase [Sulfitobacter sp. OXR-159]